MGERQTLFCNQPLPLLGVSLAVLTGCGETREADSLHLVPWAGSPNLSMSSLSSKGGASHGLPATIRSASRTRQSWPQRPTNSCTARTPISTDRKQVRRGGRGVGHAQEPLEPGWSASAPPPEVERIRYEGDEGTPHSSTSTASSTRTLSTPKRSLTRLEPTMNECAIAQLAHKTDASLLTLERERDVDQWSSTT